MVEVNSDPVTPGELAQWYEMRETLAKLKSAEALLRGRIYRHYFKDPKEGTNTYDIEDGTGAVIKAQRVIDRKVDAGALDALVRAQNEAVESNRSKGTPIGDIPILDFSKLIKWTPELSVREYRSLTDNERRFFEQCLIIKDGSPQLEIVIPKRVKTA